MQASNETAPRKPTRIPITAALEIASPWVMSMEKSWKKPKSLSNAPISSVADTLSKGPWSAEAGANGVDELPGLTDWSKTRKAMDWIEFGGQTWSTGCPPKTNRGEPPRPIGDARRHLPGNVNWRHIRRKTIDKPAYRNSDGHVVAVGGLYRGNDCGAKAGA